MVGMSCLEPICDTLLPVEFEALALVCVLLFLLTRNIIADFFFSDGFDELDAMATRDIPF